MPIELLSCIRLKHLCFIGCQGLFLPPVVGELIALESLTVNDTDWADTRDAIHQATFQRGSFSTFSLTALDLSSCNLDALPFQVSLLSIHQQQHAHGRSKVTSWEASRPCSDMQDV